MAERVRNARNARSSTTLVDVERQLGKISQNLKQGVGHINKYETDNSGLTDSERNIRLRIARFLSSEMPRSIEQGNSAAAIKIRDIVRELASADGNEAANSSIRRAIDAASRELTTTTNSTSLKSLETLSGRGDNTPFDTIVATINATDLDQAARDIARMQKDLILISNLKSAADLIRDTDTVSAAIKFLNAYERNKAHAGGLDASKYASRGDIVPNFADDTRGGAAGSTGISNTVPPATDASDATVRSGNTTRGSGPEVTPIVYFEAIMYERVEFMRREMERLGVRIIIENGQIIAAGTQVVGILNEDGSRRLPNGADLLYLSNLSRLTFDEYEQHIRQLDVRTINRMRPILELSNELMNVYGAAFDIPVVQDHYKFTENTRNDLNHSVISNPGMPAALVFESRLTFDSREETVNRYQDKVMAVLLLERLQQSWGVESGRLADTDAHRDARAPPTPVENETEREHGPIRAAILGSRRRELGA